MAAKILVVSRRTEDVTFSAKLAEACGVEMAVLTAPSQIEDFLLAEPQSAVIWDGEDAKFFSQAATVICNKLARYRVFVLTEKPMQEYPHLFDIKVYGHHILRRLDETSIQILSRVLMAALNPFGTGLDRFFPEAEKVRIQQIQIARASQKEAAVEATRNFLVKLGTIDRLASKVAWACDELLMNAIYDAPVLKDGTRYRKGGSKQADFDIDGGVTLAFGQSAAYAAISVTDRFGSVDKEQIMFCMRRIYKERAYVVQRGDVGVGLGLNTIIQSGLSLEIVTRPKMYTEAVLFFPKVSRFKDLKESFSFFGVIGT